MKHSKATVKFNINIRKAIAAALESMKLLDNIEYSVDWSNFPNSLIMRCHLCESLLNNAKLTEDTQKKAIKAIQLSFLKQGIKFRDIRNNIKFEREHSNVLIKCIHRH